MASWPATSYVWGPVAQLTMRLTMNQKIAGTVNTLTVWVTNCMGTVNTLSVSIQYSTFYPPLSSPLPFNSPLPSPTHRYIVKIYRNLKGTKYSSQVHKIYRFLLYSFGSEWEVEGGGQSGGFNLNGEKNVPGKLAGSWQAGAGQYHREHNQTGTGIVVLW
jgi:hypothetical protein